MYYFDRNTKSLSWVDDEEDSIDITVPQRDYYNALLRGIRSIGDIYGYEGIQRSQSINEQIMKFINTEEDT